MLPTCFLYAGDQTLHGHLAEIDTGEAELTDVAFRTAGQLTAVVHPDGIGVGG